MQGLRGWTADQPRASVSLRGADGTLAPPWPPALPRPCHHQLCAPDPSPQHTRSRGRLSSEHKRSVCWPFTWRAAVTSGVRGGTLERGTGDSCDWGLESKCRSSEVQTSALTPALHGRVLAPGGPRSVLTPRLSRAPPGLHLRGDHCFLSSPLGTKAPEKGAPVSTLSISLKMHLEQFGCGRNRGSSWSSLLLGTGSGSS